LDLGERRREQRQGGGRHDRAEDTLQGPGAEQHRPRSEPGRRGRTPARSRQADDEDTTTAEVVGDPPAKEEKLPKASVYALTTHLAVRDRDVQGPLGRRQGDDNDRGVQQRS